MRRPGPALALLLAACGAADEHAESPAESAAGPAGVPGLSAGQRAALEASDCGAAAEAYAAALGEREFAFAAAFWSGGEIDATRLEALYESYALPRLTIARVRETRTAGARLCTVTGALGDAAAPSRPLRQGQIELRRQPGGDGTRPDRGPWRIRSSTFIEPMQRSGTGEPA